MLDARGGESRGQRLEVGGQRLEEPLLGKVDVEKIVY